MIETLSSKMLAQGVNLNNAILHNNNNNNNSNSSNKSSAANLDSNSNQTDKQISSTIIQNTKNDPNLTCLTSSTTLNVVTHDEDDEEQHQTSLSDSAHQSDLEPQKVIEFFCKNIFCSFLTHTH